MIAVFVWWPLQKKKKDRQIGGSRMVTHFMTDKTYDWDCGLNYGCKLRITCKHAWFPLLETFLEIRESLWNSVSTLLKKGVAGFSMFVSNMLAFLLKSAKMSSPKYHPIKACPVSQSDPGSVNKAAFRWRGGVGRGRLFLFSTQPQERQ